MWSSASRKCMAAMMIAACIGGVASVARADDLPAVPDQATYVPVAKRPRSEVLVKGEQWLRPDLTRATINDYRDLLAWILQIQFNDAQCDEFEQKLIVLWPTLLSWQYEWGSSSRTKTLVRRSRPGTFSRRPRIISRPIPRNSAQCVIR